MTTPAQLMRAFDLDSFFGPQPGAGQGRGASTPIGSCSGSRCSPKTSVPLAAEKLAGFDFDFVTAALTRHFLVLDGLWKMMPWHSLANSRSHEYWRLHLVCQAW